MTKQATIIAFYGNKPQVLREIVDSCQASLSHYFGEVFQPYKMGQVHATLISLERYGASDFVNLHWARYRNEQRLMDFAGIVDYLRGGGAYPLRIQVGGFADQDYPFVSRGQRPYLRSFSIQGDIATVIGWPFNMGDTGPDSGAINRGSIAYTASLSRVRREMEAFNLLHKYHQRPGDDDNDFYFRVGLLDHSKLDPETKGEAEHHIRATMRSLGPWFLEISAENIIIAAYEDEPLSLDSTSAWSITDPVVTPEFIRSLYD